MMKKCRELNRKFLHKFKYYPEVPFDVITDDRKASEEYCQVIQKCLDDNFDYTVERYGTKADGHFWEEPDEYID